MQKKTTVFIYAILIVSIISGCSAKNKNQNVAKGDASVQAANLVLCSASSAKGCLMKKDCNILVMNSNQNTPCSI